MSFTRITYDESAYDLELKRSLDQGKYRLTGNTVENCNKCYPYNMPGTATDTASTARRYCNTGFGEIAEAESLITNRIKPLTKSNALDKNDEYKTQVKVYHKPLCSKSFESEDTRFTNPIDNYRGMSLTGYYFTPYLHINPQCHIQSNPHREGTSSRLMVRDCYQNPKQEKWDDGSTLPPKPKETDNKGKKGCKMCCE